MKFEIRCSPDVRISRSGSGQPAVNSRFSNSSSVTSAGDNRPAATSAAIDCVARRISARLPYEMKRLSVSLSLCAVCDMTRCTAAAAGGVSRSRSPSIRTRTPFSSSSSASRAMYSSSSDISAETSVIGRCQFSCEKANSDSTSIPASIAPSTTSRTAFIPLRWPNGRGMSRSRAQRPLPSMMMATCRGTAPFRRTRDSSSAVVIGNVRRCASDLHDLGFLRLDQVVDLLDRLVVHLLDVLLEVLLVVLGNAILLLHLVARLGPCMANRHPPFLGELVHDLHEVLAPLLVHRRQRDADDVPLHRRVEAEVRLADRLLHRLDLPLVERGDEQHPRPRRGDAGAWVDRHLRPLPLGGDRVEPPRRGFS